MKYRACDIQRWSRQTFQINCYVWLFPSLKPLIRCNCSMLAAVLFTETAAGITTRILFQPRCIKGSREHCAWNESLSEAPTVHLSLQRQAVWGCRWGRAAPLLSGTWAWLCSLKDDKHTPQQVHNRVLAAAEHHFLNVVPWETHDCFSAVNKECHEIQALENWKMGAQKTARFLVGFTVGLHTPNKCTRLSPAPLLEPEAVPIDVVSSCSVSGVWYVMHLPAKLEVLFCSWILQKLRLQTITAKGSMKKEK